MDRAQAVLLPFSRSVTKRTPFDGAGVSSSATTARLLSARDRAVEEQRPAAMHMGGEPGRGRLAVTKQLSWIPTPRGLRARLRNAASTSSGTMTVRAQYDMRDRWIGNQRGSRMISTGMVGGAQGAGRTGPAECA